MNKMRKRVFKYIIAVIIGLMFLVTISNTNKVNAAGTISRDNVTLSLSKNKYSYDGKSHIPTVYARFAGNTLTKGKDYDIKNPANTVDAGTKTITVVFKGRFYGVKTIKYYITGIAADQVRVYLSQDRFTYDGKNHTPNVTVYAVGKQLTPKTSYTIDFYGSLRDVGEKTVKVKLKGNYIGTITKKYYITRVNINNATVKMDKNNFIYTGKEQSPNILSITYGSRILGRGDYDIYYPKDSTKYGEKKISIVGRGNYTGTKEIKYKIEKRSIKGGLIILESDTHEYTGGQIKPKIKSVKLSNGKTQVFDYDIEYGENKYVGEGYYNKKNWIKVTGKNNNTGSIIKYFTIKPRSIAGGDVFLDHIINTYTGEEIRPKVTAVYMPNHKTRVYDYKVDYLKNIYPGTGLVKISGTNNNNGFIIKEFKIYQKDITGGKIILKKDYSKKNSPTLDDIEKVYTADGKIVNNFKLVKSTLNPNTGKATVTIEGVMYYKGNITQTFNLKGVDALLEKAAEIQKYMYKNNYEYCLKGSGCEHYGPRYSCGLTIDYVDSQTKGKYGYHNTCCATFVSWVLIESGVMERWELLQGSDGPHCASVSNYNYTGRFKEIYHPSASQIKAGDLLIYGSDHHHIEIAAKDGATNGYATVYNAGSYSAINGHKGETMRASSSVGEIDVILRLK